MFNKIVSWNIILNAFPIAITQQFHFKMTRVYMSPRTVLLKAWSKGHCLTANSVLINLSNNAVKDMHKHFHISFVHNSGNNPNIY